MTPPSLQAPTDRRQPLADAMVALSATPDDVPEIGEQLHRVALLAADRVAVADYAAVCSRPDNGCSIVATSAELVDAVDDASVSGHGTVPSSPPQHCGAASTIAWPHFRQAAAGMGLGVVSVPLFVGSGTTIATLDLYGRDSAAFAPLTVGISAAYDPDLLAPDEHEDLPALDSGSVELLTGFAEALSVRATIRLAIAVIMRASAVGADEAYLRLRLEAAGAGIGLLAAANSVIGRSLTG
ncbi:ANTAR domain-containing protein [Actinoplanes sichuanensis]|uniref:ANTAR domain-containing protein n=1 Tax=Actinoplanes sichuanensis TaxID=512349 RepID=A0ABW4A351_9ACTN